MGFMDGNMSWMIPVLRSKYITVPTRTSHRCLSFFVRLSLCCYHHWCCLQTETQWTVLGRRERCNFHPCINLKMQKKNRSVVGPRCVDGRGVLSYFYSCLPLWCITSGHLRGVVHVFTHAQGVQRLLRKCYAMDCFGTCCTHAQTCDNVRVQSATEWTVSWHVLLSPIVLAAVFDLHANDGLRFLIPKMFFQLSSSR